MRGNRRTALGAGALALLCAVAVLTPGIVESLPTTPRIVLGIALVMSGVTLATLGAVRRGPDVDLTPTIVVDPQPARSRAPDPAVTRRPRPAHRR